MLQMHLVVDENVRSNYWNLFFFSFFFVFRVPCSTPHPLLMTEQVAKQAL